MNGYSAPAKAWNNLKTYMLVREKYRKYAKFVRNNLRRPDVFYAFRIWHKASTDFNKPVSYTHLTLPTKRIV